jgi:tetratricopeptide (TPR) repeat protein
LREYLRQTRALPQIATRVFDGQLCVTERMLYGGLPNDEIIAFADGLAAEAQRLGAARGEAFAVTLRGEAALLAGDLHLAAEELSEARDLHHDLGSDAGEAHCLQRLAEVRLAQGDAVEARRLLQRALPPARWSVVAHHLMHRVYGTMITAAPTPETARAIVDQAEAGLGDRDSCSFCVVMFAVPAAIACARVGDLDQARHHIAVATNSTERWSGTAWTAALREAQAHLAVAEGDPEQARALLEEAVTGFESAGQPTDAGRARRTQEELVREALPG